MSTDSTAPPPRVIVLCFDGTSNQYGASNTNIVKFYGLLDKCCPTEQIIYYQPGIGTYFSPGVVNPMLTWLAKMADDAVAWYLSEHVMRGYQFLMQNYRAGDRICLFGFSRGAYTARALAGFLYKMGLLPRDNEEQVSFAYALYKRTDETGIGLADGFKRTFCTSVTIEFIGVWDTVASVGIIYSRSLPFTSSNSAVRVFRHALSLDERRARFQPNMFHRETPKGVTKPKDGPKDATTVNEEEGHSGAPSGTSGASEVSEVEEVWFAGCHSDVGGSAVADTVRYSLSDISLRWMVKQIILSQCGIKFDATALRRAEIDVSTVILAAPAKPFTEPALEPEAGLSSPTSGEDGRGEDMVGKGKKRDAEAQSWPREQDVSAGIHDNLVSQPAWWMLEVMPMKFMWQEADGTWKSKWGINFGRGRQVRIERPKFHDTVRERMAIKELNYKPRAKWPLGTEEYVD